MNNKSLTLTAALLAAISTNAGAAIVIDIQTAASGLPFDTNISTTDLINVGQTATYSSVASSEGTTFGSATSLNDGSAAGNANVVYDNSVASSPIIFTYTLNTSVNTLGYDITEISSIYGYNGSTTDFADQIYSVEYALVGSPSTYTGLTSVDFNPTTKVAASQITITEDATGVLASGVSSIRFLLSSNPASNQVGIAREFDVFGAATTVPEPSAFGLLAGMFGFTWVMLRRRRA